MRSVMTVEEKAVCQTKAGLFFCLATVYKKKNESMPNAVRPLLFSNHVKHHYTHKVTSDRQVGGNCGVLLNCKMCFEYLRCSDKVTKRE